MAMVVLGATISEGPSSKPTPLTRIDVRAEVGTAKLWSPMTTVEGSTIIGTPLTVVLRAAPPVVLGSPENIIEAMISPSPMPADEVLCSVLKGGLLPFVVPGPEGGTLLLFGLPLPGSLVSLGGWGAVLSAPLDVGPGIWKMTPGDVVGGTTTVMGVFLVTRTVLV
jgi:hypothetical protein